MDLSALARAASAVQLTRWRRGEGRFTCQEITKAMECQPCWPGDSAETVAGWANEVFDKLRLVGAPLPPPTSVRATIRAGCRRRTPMFDPPQTWAPDKVLAFVDGYRNRPALAAPDPASTWHYFVDAPGALFDGCPVLGNVRPSAAEFMYDSIPQSEGVVAGGGGRGVGCMLSWEWKRDVESAGCG